MTDLPLNERAVLLMSHISFQGYVIRSTLSARNEVYIQAVYEEPDTYTGISSLQYTRRWHLTPNMTDSEIVQTAFKMCLTSMEHRAREAFKYKGARIFGPHFDVEDLVSLCETRERAGGRV